MTKFTCNEVIHNLMVEFLALFFSLSAITRAPNSTVISSIALTKGYADSVHTTVITVMPVLTLCATTHHSSKVVSTVIIFCLPFGWPPLLT